MKKIYRKPVLEIESFVSEEVMASEQNVLSNVQLTDGNTWRFITIDGVGYGDNVLNSINYSDFTN